jgi:5-methyltetrahydropteroyltriglutamate--homocysteine methyltransferase
MLDRLPAYKVLSLGLVDGRNASPCNLEKTLDLLRDAHDRLSGCGVATSCFFAAQPGGPGRAEVSKCSAAGQGHQ